MIRTAPIRFTAATDAWRTLLEALGLAPVVDGPGWVVYKAGGGIVCLHAPDGRRGLTELWFEASDPKAAADAVAELGVPVTEAEDAGAGTVYRAAMGDGQLLGLAGLQTWEEGSAPRPDPRLFVLPLWMTDAIERSAAALEAVGATRRISSETGQWVDLTLDDGLVAVHDGSLDVVLSFEYNGDVDELAGRLADAGVEARVIDEAYGRSLRVDDPDGGTELWVNERMTDLYGYRKS